MILNMKKNKIFGLEFDKEELKIRCTSSFEEFAKFVELNEIEHKKVYSENNDYTEIQIEKSKRFIRFVNTNFSNLCKLCRFDIELYKTVCN